MQKDRIAIIGIGCRFPGNVNDADGFWKLLIEGREAVTEVPADRWNVQRYYDAEPAIPGKSLAKRGGFLEQIDQFDPQFFGISPREAPFVDPQHRLVLETAWEAIEDAGIVLDFEKGTDIAVYVGISHNDYQGIQSTAFDHFGITPHTPTGSAHSIAANRISYCLNLRGPSVALDTACSSALTAVHAACEHIWSGCGETALAGGVTIMITPGGFIGFSQASMLSPEGRCAAFDASANGFVRGEGAGMVLLKRLSRAIADGDPIHGVIVSSLLNQDGHTNGISLPSAEAQARLVREACQRAGVAPAKVCFVEAHGTGTAVGDPIEAHALSEALCADRQTPLPIGSCKTNLGHLETAAGIAGLLKASLVLKHRTIPPSLHFRTPNPHIDLDALKLRVPAAVEPLPPGDGERLAGVNSFGFGGANAHVILAEPPSPAHGVHQEAMPDRPWPLMLSARSENALRAGAKRLADWLAEHSNCNGDSPVLPDLTYTLGARRNHHAHRLTLVAKTIPLAIEELRGFSDARDGVIAQSAFTPRPEHPLRVGFVMSGQGPQWWGMGRELMRHEPVFREVIERCDAAMQDWADFSLLEEFGRGEDSSQMARTRIAQPAIFAMQLALAELWKSWGVQPAAVMGHSVSEVAAACLAGILPLEVAARLIVLRARFMDECARGEGTMLALGLAEDDARALMTRHDRTVTIAAFNGPRSVTLAGPRSSLEAILAEVEPQGIFARLVRVDHPFHHPLMSPASEALEEALADLEPREAAIPFFSTVSGARCQGEDCSAEHWARGVREPVLFAPAVNAMAEHGVDVWLELGAHPALGHSIKEILASRNGAKSIVISSLRREREHESALEAAMDLHRAGVVLDYRALSPSRRLLPLPAYAWDRSRWWNEAADWRESRLAPGGRALLETRLPRAVPTWTCRLDARHMEFLQDHRVESHVIFPAAAFVDIVLEAGIELFEGRPFVIEDFEIRRPLILPDPASGVQIEISYDPAERAFAIQSRFEQSTAWSLHVVGAMRAERVESAFAADAFRPAEALEDRPVQEFYQYMADLGLRYGEAFRPIRQLSAGAGRSVGMLAIADGPARRATEYPLHPVLFDGALQTFSAGAATVESRRARMKLPVRFARIEFLQSPGASAKVTTEVIECSDDFVEGRIAIFADDGRPCVLVDGFRAISVAGVRHGGSGSGRGLVYHETWEAVPSDLPRRPLAPLPLLSLRAAADGAIEPILAMRGRETLEAVIHDSDDLAASQLCRGLRAMGISAGQTVTAESLGVVDLMRPVFERLLAKLSGRGLFKAKDSGFVALAAFEEAANSAEDAQRIFLTTHPAHLPEALLVAGNCSELGAILRGEKDAVQVLFSGSGAELLDHFYGDGLLTSHWLAGISAAVQESARALPEGRGLRILEVGAGTGGLSAEVLSGLERGVHSYLFTDASAAFFAGAAQKLAAFPEVETRVFDLDKDIAGQGFDPAGFDLIIGTNVLHAASDLRKSLRRLHDLLAPGGTLIFLDVATPQLWTEAVFGLTSGWWRFSDRDLRPDQPLLPRDRWEELLVETGFSETASIPGLFGPFGEGQFTIFGRKGSQPASITVEPKPDAVEGSWLVVSDGSDVAARLGNQLVQADARCRLVCSGSASTEAQFCAETREDWRRLLAEGAGELPFDRIVCFGGLGGGDPSAEACALMHLVQSLEELRPGARVRLDWITRDAQPAGRDARVTDAPGASAIGLLRVVLNEYPNLTCRSIDLASADPATALASLWSELLRSDSEREIAFRGEARYVRRLDRGSSRRERSRDEAVPVRLESRERGHLDTLRFAPFVLPPCGDNEVIIDVRAAGMNFRDVLKALALYPGEAPDARIFGDEVGGIVVETGRNVSHVEPGNRVFGLAVFGLASRTIARGGDVRRIPDGLSFEEAATVPVVFMTAWHSLVNVARLRKGERILIHAGAGGVGMAAIQIARHLGAEIIASAGSPAKRRLLKTLGVHHVIDSRRGDFLDAVMGLTGRQGVHVVLNALAGEAIPMGLACLGEFGRFIEIGKRDIYQNSRIPLWPMRRNASFHVVAMDAVFRGDEELTRQMLAEIAELIERKALHPLSFRTFPANRVDAAFRLMAGGRHIGKVVVGFAEPFLPSRTEPLAPGFEVRPDGSYLITGGLGGFGRVLANWLAEKGARHLVLASRSGASTEETIAFVKDLRARGTNVQIEKADISSPGDVEHLLGAIGAAGRPLRGIFHLAMTLDDAPLAALNAERMRAVIAPKAIGAWLLHQGTLDMPLDCFVMFSSVSSTFGNPAQGNYAAANAVLDALAHHRRGLGLPALTVNWGVLGETGYVARNERVREFLERQGTFPLAPREVISLLENALQGGDTQLAAIRVDWAKWAQFFRGMQENPLLQRIFASIQGPESDRGTSQWRQRIEAAAPSEKEGIIAQAVREVVGSVLRVKPETLRDDAPLTDLGLDSLMGVEIETSLEAAVGVALPPTSLMRARTIGQIAALIAAQIGGASAEPAPAGPPETPSAPSSPVGEADLDALSDEDVERLLSAADEKAEAAVP